MLPMLCLTLAQSDLASHGANAAAQHAGGSQPLGVVLLIMLATAALVGAVLKRFKIEAIPGYLIAGALVGPHALGLVQHESSAESISQLATVLLLFGIGLHLDLDSIRKGLVHILAVGAVSTAVFILLFWGVLLLFGVARPAALALALAASISSTAILVRILQARRELQQQHGRVAMGVSIVQDLASVAMLAMLPLIAAWAGSRSPDVAGAGSSSGIPEWLATLATGAKAIGGVIALLWVGRIVLPWILQRIASLASQELMLVTSAAIALASAGWTSFIGFSPEMGAFLAGFLLASTPFRFQLSGQLGPMRDLLMAVFFTGVGLLVNPAELGAHWLPIVGAALAVMVLKVLVTAGTAWMAGMTVPASMLVGFYMANAGEFTLVVVGGAGALGILDDTLTAGAVAVVILTLLATPLLVGPSHLLAEMMARWPLSPWARSSVLREGEGTGMVPAAHPADAPMQSAAPDSVGAVDQMDLGGAHSLRSVILTPGVETGTMSPEVPPPAPLAAKAPPKPRRVVIAGFGPVGRALADRFAVQGIDFTVVELNASTVKRQHVLGRAVVYGDITNPEVLERAGIHHADAIILTIPDDEATMRACQTIRELAPHIFIAARTSFLSGKFTAMTLGADVVTVEEVATASAMERDVLDGLDQFMRKGRA